LILEAVHGLQVALLYPLVFGEVPNYYETVNISPVKAFREIPESHDEHEK
jgi:hypothetical protein